MEGAVFGGMEPYCACNLSIAVLMVFSLPRAYHHEKNKHFLIKKYIFIPTRVCLSELYTPVTSPLPEMQYISPINRLLMNKHLISFQNQRPGT